jgi:hypothetical protein
MATIYDEINKNPSRKELFKFGVAFLVGMAAIGLLYHFVIHREEVARVVWITGGAVFLLSFIKPIARILYIFWMGLGITIGLITSPIILVIVYLFLITPVGLLFKLLRRDAMRRKLQPEALSYWEKYDESEDPATYMKQF